MEYRLSRCDFQDAAGPSLCSFTAMYRVTLVSAEGPTCELLLCAEHVEKSWGIASEVLRRRFPRLNLTLGSVRLDPVPRASAANGD